MFDAADGWSRYEDATFVATLGSMHLREAEGSVEIGLEGGPHLRNLSGSLHGGVLMTLLDRAGGIVARQASAGRRVATASITVNFLRPARPEDGIVVRARLVRARRKSYFVDAEAHAGARLTATASMVFLRVDAPEDRAMQAARKQLGAS